MLKTLFSDLYSDLIQKNRTTFILQLTCLCLVFRSVEVTEYTLYSILLSLIAAIMLLSKKMLYHRDLWLIVFAILLAVCFLNFFTQDNHRYLIAYWMLVCAFVAGSKKSLPLMRWNACVLIGLAFSFAFVWKIIGGSYLDGSFFHETFLGDRRFQAFTVLFGGLKSQDVAFNTALYSAFKEYAVPGMKLAMVSTPTMQVCALVSSYWTLAIEGLIAASFLIKKRQRWIEMRDYYLIFFIVTTYFLAPVRLFGSVLALMGFAQCDPRKKHIEIAYLSLLVYMELCPVLFMGLKHLTNTV